MSGEVMSELLTLSNRVEFESLIQQELSLIAFGTPWSSPCRQQHEILMNFARHWRGTMVVARIDVEKHSSVARKCNIQTVPTLIVYSKKRERKRLVGVQSLEMLDEIIKQQVEHMPGDSLRPTK